MDSAMIALVVTASLLLVALVIVIIRVVRLTALNARLDACLTAQKERAAEREEAWRNAAAERAALEEKMDAEREKLFASQKLQMEESFKALSEQNSAGLRRQNAESITELLKPIAEKFEGFEKTINSNQEKAVAQDASMRELLQTLTAQSRSVGEEARNLANALTGHSKIQGNFGEMLLVDLLKSSGLQEGIHFRTQGVLTDELGHEIRSEDGSAMIPDVIVYYPDDSEVIIDSKVSLNAYASYVNSQSIEDRRRYAKEHVDSVIRHIDELKSKDYASYIADGKKKVDYNIMFIPMEGAFRLMLEEAPILWQRAKDAKVLIVSQMNLMIVLNMILMSWRQHDQEKNITEVYKTAGELMGQLRNWLDSFVKIGENLEKATSSYEDSKKKLVDSNQSVIRKIDKLEQLKISPKRSNAKIKAGTRIVAGQESVIPSALAEGLASDKEED